MHEKRVFERLFDRGGYVLDFTDNTFAEFFREHRINIEAEKYHRNGKSKMKRLRAFWEIEPDNVVGRLLKSLLEYACEVKDVKEEDRIKAIKVIYRLQGKNQEQKTEQVTERDFLKKEFAQIDWVKLNIDLQLQPVIEQRIIEIQKSLQAKASLAVIFLCGSTLEGLLQDIASRNQKSFNQAKAAPIDKKEKVKPFYIWKLEELINVAYEIGLISLDVKKYSHSLKDFRNYIHPHQQAVQQFNPDIHTAKISWQVLQAAIANMSEQR